LKKKTLKEKEIIEIITDKKTFVILEALKGGEKATAQVLVDTGIFSKSFYYFTSKLNILGLVNSRNTFKTLLWSIDKEGIAEFIDNPPQTKQDISDFLKRISVYK